MPARVAVNPPETKGNASFPHSRSHETCRTRLTQITADGVGKGKKNEARDLFEKKTKTDTAADGGEKMVTFIDSTK